MFYIKTPWQEYVSTVIHNGIADVTYTWDITQASGYSTQQDAANEIDNLIESGHSAYEFYIVEK